MARNTLEHTTPVIIIGGGPIGLTCSILLSIRGIPNALFERHPSTSIHPKAAGINQRTSEVFRVMGIEDEVYAHAAPAEIAGRTAWYTSLGSEGREIFSRDAWGGGQYKAEYAAHSPSKYCILPQIRLEPILKRRAFELNPAGIYYDHEVLTADNKEDIAEVTVKNRITGEVSQHNALYLIVADGGHDPPTFNEETVLARVRKTIGIPDLDIELISLTHWTVNALYASQWRVGRIFLVGDSAHRIPPWGALGMNTGIQDAHNLIWKLSLALKDHERYSALLDTYQIERLDVGRRVGETSLKNMRSHAGHIDAAMGISLNQTIEENIAAGATFFDTGHPDYARKQKLIEEASRELDTEFKAPGYEVGWFYPSADINSEGGETHGGQQLPDGTLVHHTYYPSTIPGHHLPHAWVERDGRTVAIRDILDLNLLTLFVETDQNSKVDDDRVHVVIIGSGGWQDTTGRWQKYRGVDASGGVLVRPDGIVAWRGALETIERLGWERLMDRVLKVAT